MKAHFLTFLFVVVFSGFSFCQDLQQIFFEDFLNNDFKWYTVQDKFDVMKVENGEYHLQQFIKAPDYVTYIGCGIEELKDFSVEAVFRFISGNQGDYGIIWGVKDEKNYCSFIISDEGRFLVRFMHTETMIGDIKKSAPSSFIKSTAGSKNTLKITKKGKNLLFDINGNQVFIMPFEPFYGNCIGFCIDGIINVAVESVKINASRKFELTETVGNLTRMRVFAEDFIDNSNSWSIFNDNVASSEIKDGFYNLNNKIESKAHYAKQTVTLSNERDFIIECNTKKVSGAISYGYGLMFGKKGLNEAYRFLITTDGFVRISKKEFDKNVPIVDWRPCAAIYMGPSAENRLILVKKGKKLMFFINAVLVYTIDDFSFPIQDVGLYVDGVQKVGFDYLKINNLVEARQSKPSSR